MCKAMEEIHEEGKQEKAREIALTMLYDGLHHEKIAEYTKLPLDKVKEIHAGLPYDIRKRSVCRPRMCKAMEEIWDEAFIEGFTESFMESFNETAAELNLSAEMPSLEEIEEYARQVLNERKNS